MKLILKIYLLSGMLIGCASDPKPQDPTWIHQPTRIVDGGYIVYVESAEDMRPERASFKAEGLALEDLANECSVIPKGTRIEDRYAQKPQYATTSFIKIAVEFQECDVGRKSVDPDAVRKVASVPFTEQLKKYQDLIETGEMPHAGAVAETDYSEDLPPPPAGQPGQETAHFYATRQYIVYQKEVVILAPPTAYAVNSVETQKYYAQVQPLTQQVQTVANQNPQLLKNPKPWSTIANRPVVMRPANLAPKNRVNPQRDSLHPPSHPQNQPSRGSYRGRGAGRKQGRRGKNKKQEN